jgi:hypothetical protein
MSWLEGTGNPDLWVVGIVGGDDPSFMDKQTNTIRCRKIGLGYKPAGRATEATRSYHSIFLF